MGCGCKKNKKVAPKPTVTPNKTQNQQEKLVNEIIDRINKRG